MSPQSTQINPLFIISQFVLIIGIFYFILIRPQRLEQKKRQEMLNSINKNDEVVTTGGIHGTIVNIKDKTVILRIDENVKVELEKSCIAYIKKTQGSN
jgi:preprotein translocase subunit YajC